MIYVTGDIHGDIDIHKLNTQNFPEQSNLTKDDYVIICGDFGLVWDDSNYCKYWLKWLDNKPWTTLFVDGNHENHDMLDAMELIFAHGGWVHRISHSVVHLMRGQVYTIDGNKIFAFGGAASIDKQWRVEGKSWWAREIPSEQEMQDGIDNLSYHNNNVDYIISHTCPYSIFSRNYDEEIKLAKYFDKIVENVDFKHWYFGHYHTDKTVHDKFTCLYKDIVRIV